MRQRIMRQFNGEVNRLDDTGGECAAALPQFPVTHLQRGTKSSSFEQEATEKTEHSAKGKAFVGNLVSNGMMGRRASTALPR